MKSVRYDKSRRIPLKGIVNIKLIDFDTQSSFEARHMTINT